MEISFLPTLDYGTTNRKKLNKINTETAEKKKWKKDFFLCMTLINE